jgi:hypothetical protein
MERTAAVLHAEVVMGAAIAKRARGADVNFIVDGFTPARGFSNNKNGVVVWRKKAFIVPSPHLAFSDQSTITRGATRAVHEQESQKT